jgi:anionic cell wall polymer biosynthesis LytR-Cps2A-Psr (LCP) family protein
MNLDRKFRPVIGTAIIVNAFLLLLVGVIVFVPTPHSAQETLKAKPVRSLLVQIRDVNQRSIGSVLINVGSAQQPEAEVISLPANLQLTSPTGYQVNLADVTVPPYPQQAVTGLRVSTGLGVDGELLLERLGFAGLIDYVGGVNVRVDEAFTTITPELKTITIRPGLRHLRGIGALSYLGEGNPQLSQEQRTAHLRSVLQQFLQRLNIDSYRVSQVLVTAGLAARSSVPTDGVAELLVLAGRTARDHRIVWRDLPVLTRLVGISGVSLVDQQGVAELIHRDHLQTLTEFAVMPGTRVLVKDASGVPNLALSIRTLLAKTPGLGVVAGSLASTGQVIAGVPSGTTAVVAANRRSAHAIAIARTLGVHLISAPTGALPTRVEVLVLVGSDIVNRLRDEL